MTNPAVIVAFITSAASLLGTAIGAVIAAAKWISESRQRAAAERASVESDARREDAERDKAAAEQQHAAAVALAAERAELLAEYRTALAAEREENARLRSQLTRRPQR